MRVEVEDESDYDYGQDDEKEFKSPPHLNAMEINLAEESKYRP